MVVVLQLVHEMWRMDGVGGGDRLARQFTAGLCTHLWGDVRVSCICGRVLLRVSRAEALDSLAALAVLGCVCLCGVGRCEWVCRALCWCSVRVLCRVCKMVVVGAVLHSVYLVDVTPRLGGMLALKLGLGRRSPSMPYLMCAGSWARPAEAGVGEVEQQGCLAT